MRCLEKDPRRRFGSAAELAEELERRQSLQRVQTPTVGHSRVLGRRLHRLGQSVRRLGRAAPRFLLIGTLLTVFAVVLAWGLVLPEWQAAQVRQRLPVYEDDMQQAAQAEWDGNLGRFRDLMDRHHWPAELDYRDRDRWGAFEWRRQKLERLGFLFSLEDPRQRPQSAEKLWNPYETRAEFHTAFRWSEDGQSIVSSDGTVYDATTGELRGYRSTLAHTVGHRNSQYDRNFKKLSLEERGSLFFTLRYWQNPDFRGHLRTLEQVPASARRKWQQWSSLVDDVLAESRRRPGEGVFLGVDPAWLKDFRQDPPPDLTPIWSPDGTKVLTTIGNHKFYNVWDATRW
jgi:hypothetical protein